MPGSSLQPVGGRKQAAPLRVLVVDDCEADFSLVSACVAVAGSLNGRGFQCEWATDAGSARAALDDGAFDACLVDDYLGGTSGAELIAQLRSGEHSTALVLLTGSLRRDADVEAMAAGADDCLGKDELTPALMERTLRHAIERRRLVTELERRSVAAEAAAGAKTAFLATMSHEIRNPMSGVMGMSALLLETALDDEQREYAGAIRRASSALLTIVNDVLDISKIDAGKIELETQDFNLPMEIRETVDLLADTAHQKGVGLRCVVDPGLPRYVSGDSARLRQVLMNLVGNAVKFTDVGHIQVKASLDEEREANDSQAWVRVEVADTGAGIPEADIAAMFDPYVQAEASTTRRFGGTGLGLAICKRLTELMGGAVGVRSEVGVGSTFHVTLPLTDPTKRAALTPLEAYRGRVALVVDHDLARRTALISELTSCGLRAEAVGSAPSALAFLRDCQELVDLVLVDYDLHGDRAGSLLATIAAQVNPPPTILVSTPAQRRRAMDAHVRFDGHVSKPIRPLRLRRSVDRVLAESAESGRAPSGIGPIARKPPEGSLFRDAEVRVLVADDDPINCAVVKRSLERVGCAVEVAEDGELALDALEHGEFDIVFMDGQMPRLDGYDATRQIRRREDAGTRQVVIALTGNAGDEARRQCVDAGMDDYLVKPVTPTDLRNMLERWVDRLQPATPNADATHSKAA